MLAVVVSNVEVEGEYEFRAADVWQPSRTTAIVGRMVNRARGPGSGYGIDGAILETSLGSTGTVLETATREAGGRKPEVRNLAFGAGAVQSRAAGAQEGFPRCRTLGAGDRAAIDNFEDASRFAPPSGDFRRPRDIST